jgi:Fungal protein kinase
MRRGTLRSDLVRLKLSTDSEDFDFYRIIPLLGAVITSKPDEFIWNKAYDIVTESTPPPRPVVSSLQQTPRLRNTSSFVNSTEHRKYMDAMLRDELGPLYVGIPSFHETIFGGVPDLEISSKAVFKKCTEGDNPLFCNGWSEWPADANQGDVLTWIAQLSEQFAKFAEGNGLKPKCQRRPLAQPDKPLQGSIADRKLDVGFVSDSRAGKDSRCHWSQILIPGELKSNPSADIASKAWLDLGRYVREVLAAQDTRHFVLGFTLCGSFMRVWEFDRLGGIASERFDINRDALQFISTILGFLWMDEEQLGFDPAIIVEEGRRYIDIDRNGYRERLVIDELMKRAPCIAGRATTCWKAYRKGDLQTPLVIKDSWQYLERDEEGELLREAAEKGVVNAARYYHHETVLIRGKNDDIRSNIRKGLDITKAENYRIGSLVLPRKGQSSCNISRKRSSDCTNAPLPPTKRPCSSSPTKAGSNALSNRVRRRVILRDYGKAIYKASSPTALLAALEDCIEGYESLHKRAGILHCDISPNNLLFNKEGGFLIDLDLAIREGRMEPSGAWGKTGTRAFMAIGVLLGEKHSFMHDLESFFWVLFWICIHYKGPHEWRVVPFFEKWNYADTKELAYIKKAIIDDERDFMESVEENFTQHYQPLIPCVNKLRRVVFPDGGRWGKEDRELYPRMKETLREARKDLTGI